MAPSVPTYALYGEDDVDPPEFWGHAETIASRSRLHDWEIKPHRHDVLFQILHLRTGSVEALLRGHGRDVPTPCMIVVPERQEHGFRFSEDIDGAVMTFVSRRMASLVPVQSTLETWLRQPRALALDPADPEKAYLADTLDRIEMELGRGTPAHATLVGHLSLTALLLACRIDSALAPLDDAERDHRRLNQLAELVDAHFREHRPVDFYAGRLGLSVTHLNRLTRARIAKPVSRLLAERILAEAKRDLVFTTHPVQMIAERLGFEDAAYFSRFFSHNAGVSPRRFRELELARLEGQTLP